MRKMLFVVISVLILLSFGCGSGGGGSNQVSNADSSDNNSPTENNTDNPSSQIDQVNTKPVAIIKGNISAKPGQTVETSGAVVMILMVTSSRINGL